MFIVHRIPHQFEAWWALAKVQISEEDLHHP